MYAGLSVINILYCADVVSIVREYLSSISLRQLRESVLFLLEIVTDLSFLSPRLFRSGTPSCEMLQRAILDALYFGSASRPSNFVFVFKVTNFMRRL